MSKEQLIIDSALKQCLVYIQGNLVVDRSNLSRAEAILSFVWHAHNWGQQEEALTEDALD